MNLLLLNLLLTLSTPLMIAYAFWGLANAPRLWRKYLPFLILSVGMIAYCYEPVGHPDLVRYFEKINYCKDLTLKETFVYFNDNLFISNVLFWVAGKMGMPHLIPALSTMTVYGTASYITCDFSDRSGNSKAIVRVLLYLCCILPFVSIMNNVRNVCAFSLIILAVYRELVKKNRDLITILLYILPCFIHMTGFILVLFRLVVILIGRQFFIAAGIVGLMPMAIKYIVEHLNMIPYMGGIGIIIRKALVTAYYAMNSSSKWANTIMTSRYHLAQRYASFAVAVLFCVLLLFYSRKKNVETKEFYGYLGVVYIFTLGCNVFRTPAYWRFFAAGNIGISTLLTRVFCNNMMWSKKQLKLIKIVLWSFALVLLTLQLYGGRANINLVSEISNVIIIPFPFVLIKMIVSLFYL